MRMRIGLLVGTAAGLLSFGVAASDALYPKCVDCTPSQMLQTAVDLKQGTWVVWNPTDGSVRGYRVACTNECAGIELPVPQGVRDVASTLFQLSKATNGTNTAKVRASNWHIPTRPHPTARDYLGDGNYRAQLHDRLEAGGWSSGDSKIDSYVGYLREHADVARMFTDSQATLTVVFEDGSRVNVALNPDMPAQYVKGSARDSSGKPFADDSFGSVAKAEPKRGGR